MTIYRIFFICWPLSLLTCITPLSVFAESHDLLELLYDKNKIYYAGDAVFISLNDSELYTARILVPVNTPPPNETYWMDHATTVQGIENTYGENWADIVAKGAKLKQDTNENGTPLDNNDAREKYEKIISEYPNIEQYLKFNPGFRRDGSPMDPSIPDHFDVDGYYDRNHDVRDAFQNLANDDVLAYNHYLEEGVTIDRMFDNNFVPREYLNIYVDLKVLFTDSDGNTDLVGATKHWFDYGRAEGRKGRFEMPEWFDAQAYQDTYHDVRDAIAGSSFGEDTEAWWHFYRTGAPLEGRSFDDTRFNLDAYIARNPDLKVFFRRSDGKIDKKGAMYHYISDGHAEGRVDSFNVPTWFDVNEYRTNNPDVAAAPEWNSSDFLIFNHFYRFGAPKENRTLSNFNLTTYIELNADIAKFYGSTTTEERRECMIHYMADGFAEGRKAID